MAVNFSTQVYGPAFDVFSRPVTFTPLKSKPAPHTPYTARGIYGTMPLDVIAEDSSIVSDQRTILDIRAIEFDVPPIQGDLVEIGASSGIPSEGLFQIIDVDSNAGGELTLFLRKKVIASP